MSANTVDRLHVAVLDGHLMDDATLARLVPECRSLTAFTTGADQSGLEQRWAAIAPGTELIDGGRVADLREAMVECAKRRIVVISTGVPADPASFVAHALQGAAAMTEFDVPGVAVHVMRPVERPGSVAWLTDTGELSGYGVLFAVGYAHLHSTGVDLIEPSSGLGRPRTAEALDDALAFAEAAGVPVTRHTDPSPFARVLRDEHCMVVHPVLDAPKGFNLLHPGELSRKAVASGNPAVVVELLEQFPGDVVAVFDGVHLLQGSIPAARIAAGVALGVVAAAGVGTMVASPAMADSHSSSSQHEHGNSVDVDGHVDGISWVATPHEHGSTTLTLRNTTGHDIVVRVVGGHGHEGGRGRDPRCRRAAHGYTNVTLGGGVKQWTISPGQHHTDTPDPRRPLPRTPIRSWRPGRSRPSPRSPVTHVVAVPGRRRRSLRPPTAVPADAGRRRIRWCSRCRRRWRFRRRSRSPCRRSRLPCRRCRSRGRRMSRRPRRLGCRRRFRRRFRTWCRSKCRRQAIPQVVPQPQAPDPLVPPPLQPTLVPPLPQQVPPTGVPQPDAPDLVAPPLQPTLVPQVQQQVPPTRGPEPDAPDLVAPPLQPTLVPPVQQAVPADAGRRSRWCGPRCSRCWCRLCRPPPRRSSPRPCPAWSLAVS